MDRKKNNGNKKTSTTDSQGATKAWREEDRKKKQEENFKKIKETAEQIKLKPYIIGLDISTAIIGITCLERQTGNLVFMDSVKLTSVKTDTVYSKADLFLKDFVDMLQLHNIKLEEVNNLFVEESAKMFTPGFSSANTIITLAKFNAIICYAVYKMYGIEPRELNVRSARAKLGIKIDTKDKSKTTKEKVREIVIQLFPNLPLTYHIAKNGKQKGQNVLDKENEDKIDSFIIAKAGLII